MINNQAYCLAVEQLLGVEVPQRAKYLRTLTAELQRVAMRLLGSDLVSRWPQPVVSDRQDR